MHTADDLNLRVNEWRKAVPWAGVGATRFMGDVVRNVPWTNAGAADVEAVLRVEPRPEVRGGLWWTITWTGADGDRYTTAADHLDTLLWRAAEMEIAARERAQ